MILTREQFDGEIKNYFHFIDLPFRGQTDEEMFRLFNLLPQHLQGLAIQWGASDTVFRDEFFEFMCKNQFNMTVSQYYDSQIFKDFFNEEIYQQINWEKLL